MSNASQYIKLFCIAAITIFCWGCGKGNDNAPAVAVSGTHPANWRTAHRKAYLTNPSQCKECHGADLMGGITKVGCSTGSCHANGHPPRQIAHAMPFLTGTVHGPVAKVDLAICNDCHGRQISTTAYRFDIPTSTMPNGCESTGCHNNAQQAVNLGHPKTWLKHDSAGNQANACSLCHGATFQGDTGPACSICHVKLAPGVIPVASQNCGSCHGNPPNGSTHPNMAGSHAKHTALPGVTCSACHLGAGSGTIFHYYSSRIVRAARVKFSASYNAKTGVAALNADKTCANVKCHGGRNYLPVGTPVVWGSTFDSASPNNCQACHEQGSAKQSPQYNSYYSGQHVKHLQLGLACTDCHDQKILFRSSAPSHFSNLSSVTFDLDPSLTMKQYLNYTIPARTCAPSTPPSDNQFVFGCHPAPDITKFWGTP